MRLTYRPGTPTRLLVVAPVLALVLSGLAAGCSSSKPTYCTDAANLKTSVSDLGNVDVAKNGLSSLQTALTSVTSDAKKFAADAKSAFAPQTTALQNSLSSLEYRDHVREEPAFRDRGHGGRVLGHAGEDLGQRSAKCRISIRKMLANKCPAGAPGSAERSR